MDQSDEHIDIVGDDTEMECRDEEETIPKPQPTEDNNDYDNAEQSSEEHHHLSIVPLTVQITPDSEPSGAKKRKPLKTTKLQVCLIKLDFEDQNSTS